jgi:hypothetical protein
MRKRRDDTNNMQLSLLDRIDITESRHGGNAESTEAFESIKHYNSKVRELVRSHIQACGLDGATVDEIEIALGMSHQTASARATELKATGQIFDSGFRRETRSGRNAAVLVVQGVQNGSPDNHDG